MTSYKSHSEEYIDYIKQTLYPLLYQGKAMTYTVCTFNIYLYHSLSSCFSQVVNSSRRTNQSAESRVSCWSMY